MLVKRLFSKELKKKKILSVRDFYEKRNTVLIIRNARGIGDILMCRMIFEDFKKLNPEMKLVFACFKQYHNLVKDHPYIDEVVDSKEIDPSDYLISYNITSCSEWYESMAREQNTNSRPEIWADKCGVELTTPNMYLPFISKNMMDFGISTIKKLNKLNKPTVLFCPFTFESLRTLNDLQIKKTIDYLKNKGLFVYMSHPTTSDYFKSLGIHVLYGTNTLQWFSLIHAADYVISADTAAFHYAGGIKKPLIGVFTHIDGKTRGKHYDFVLVQKHRDNGDWPCGPCYNYLMCSNPNCKDQRSSEPRPCLTELTPKEIADGIEKMLLKWPIKPK